MRQTARVGCDLRTDDLRNTLIVGLLLFVSISSPARGGPGRFEMHSFQLELPGPPALILPVDVDADGMRDLVIVTAYSTWSQIAVEESVFLDEVEGLVEMMTIVPAMLDRREIRWYRGLASGSYEAVGEWRALPKTVWSLVEGNDRYPVLAMLGDGVAAVQLLGGDTGSSLLRPLLQRRSAMRGVEALLLNQQWMRDLDADGLRELVFPADHGLAIYRFRDEGLEFVTELPWPPRRDTGRHAAERFVPLPLFRDLDGDRLEEVVFLHPLAQWDRPWILSNRGHLEFGPLLDPRDPDQDVERSEDDDVNRSQRREMVFLGDLDGDGTSEWLQAEDLSDNDVGLRREMKQAKAPPYRYSILAAGPSFLVGSPKMKPFVAIGFAFEMSGDLPIPGGLQDLDGDGRLDLVTVTLDFSVLQAVRILATRSISIGLDFHVFCQQSSGEFRAVEGLDLSGKFKLRLDDLRLGQLSQFAGDFDGDGRADFLQAGRGKKATVHLGAAGCRYSTSPDSIVEFEEEPKNLALLRVDDFDGDGRSDLLLMQPGVAAAGDRSGGERSGPGLAGGSSVRLYFYFSRGEPR